MLLYSYNMAVSNTATTHDHLGSTYMTLVMCMWINFEGQIFADYTDLQNHKNLIKLPNFYTINIIY